MSHRKFRAPRHGSLGFSPRKRTKHHHGHIRGFPVDRANLPVHFTAFVGFKAGMTHVLREIERPNSKLHHREVCEPVTVMEVPPMVVVGVVGYKRTERGLRAVKTVWAHHLDENVRRRFVRSWYHSKHAVFRRYVRKYEPSRVASTIERDLAKIKSECSVIRAIAHTQPHLLNIKQRRAHVVEIQINGGRVPEKVDFTVQHFEKHVAVSEVFAEGEMIDLMAATKGKGFQGVTKRWGTKRLPRKTRRGLRRVACIGAWHPARVSFTVARAGQMGYHHRTEINKRIYRIGSGADAANASTSYDLTRKTITPIGGFPHFGIVRQDFLLIRGSVPGATRRVIAIRKALIPPKRRAASEPLNLKWIDTASKRGHGQFQTSDEKNKFLGDRKPRVAAAMTA